MTRSSPLAPLALGGLAAIAAAAFMPDCTLRTGDDAPLHALIAEAFGAARWKPQCP